MARQELSAICRAVGVMKPKDTSELEHRPLVVTLAIKNRSDGGGLANEIRAYERAPESAGAEEIPV